MTKSNGGIIMKQEDKQLLLKDLSARLPYGVKVQLEKREIVTLGDIDIVHERDVYDIWYNGDNYPIEDVKPYLRPMYSMTEEEENEICQFMKDYNLLPGADRAGVFCSEIVDWLNSHHFDYRGLIEKGLAIEVNESNNPYK